MIHAFTSEQIWEAIEILSPNDIDNFVTHCNREYERDYDKDINDIICTLSDDAFINEVEFIFSSSDIETIVDWLAEEYMYEE